MRFLYGIITASLFVIAWHVKLQYVVWGLFHNGDGTDWGDRCKQPTYKQMTGRLPNE